MRGRPVKSVVRERMEQIVDALGVTYGYEVFKVYTDAFAPIDLRSMYYHLNKGLGLGVFELVGVRSEKGNFTWGDVSVRRYYILGPSAAGKATDDLHIIVKTLGLNYREPKDYVDWQQLLKERAAAVASEVEVLLRAKKPSLVVINNLNKKLSSLIGWFEEKKINTKGLEELRGKLEGFGQR